MSTPNLTADQRAALHNLSRKKAGDEVNWITIADARSLTDLGLAERNASGWQITEKGAEVILASNATTDAVNDGETFTTTTPFRPQERS